MSIIHTHADYTPSIYKSYIYSKPTYVLNVQVYTHTYTHTNNKYIWVYIHIYIYSIHPGTQ